MGQKIQRFGEDLWWKVSRLDLWHGTSCEFGTSELLFAWPSVEIKLGHLLGFRGYDMIWSWYVMIYDDMWGYIISYENPDCKPFFRLGAPCSTNAWPIRDSICALSSDKATWVYLIVWDFPSKMRPAIYDSLWPCWCATWSWCVSSLPILRHTMTVEFSPKPEKDRKGALLKRWTAARCVPNIVLNGFNRAYSGRRHGAGLSVCRSWSPWHFGLRYAEQVHWGKVMICPWFWLVPVSFFFGQIQMLPEIAKW